MPKTITAMYDDFTKARRVADALAAAGIPQGEISVIANDSTGRYASSIRDTAEHRVVADDEELTAEQGAGFGMIVGALVGMAAMIVPGIGPVIAAGPLVSVLIGAGVGAVAGAFTGGLVAGLTHMGIPEEDVEFYAEGVRRGGTLLIARVPDEKLVTAVDLLREHEPINLQRRADYWRQTGWAGFDEKAEPYSVQDMNRERESYPPDSNGDDADRVRMYPADVETSAEESDFDAFHQDFYDHYWGHFQITGRSYDDYLPAYQYGYQLAHDARYNDLEWPRLEPRARLYWEEHHGSPWDDIKDAVGYAWNRVRAAVDNA
jgi:hypothetical protein